MVRLDWIPRRRTHKVADAHLEPRQLFRCCLHLIRRLTYFIYIYYNYILRKLSRNFFQPRIFIFADWMSKITCPLKYPVIQYLKKLCISQGCIFSKEIEIISHPAFPNLKKNHCFACQNPYFALILKNVTLT